MKNSEWVETRRECDVNDRGEYVVKKVTLEIRKKKILGIERKDFYDLLIKIVGLFAIFIPVYLFFMARTAEIKKQKSIMQFEIYSSISAELQNVLNKGITNPEYQRSKEKLMFELKPKVMLLNDTAIVRSFDKILVNIRDHADIYLRSVYLDSLIKYSKVILATPNWASYSDSVTAPIDNVLRTMLMDHSEVYEISQDLINFDIPLYVDNSFTILAKRADNKEVEDRLQTFRSDLIMLVQSRDQGEKYEYTKKLQGSGITYVLTEVKAKYPEVAAGNRRRLSQLVKKMNELILNSNSMLVPN